MTDLPRLPRTTPIASNRWRAELDKVRLLRDANGMSVDVEIEEAVTVLRLLGYATTMSCGGHADRPTMGPYVVIEAKGTRDVVKKANRELNQVRKQALFRCSQRMAQREVEDLRDRLDSFNRDSVLTRAGHFLHLQSIGHSKFRLCFVHADFDGILDGATHREVIRARRTIMNVFIGSLVTIVDDEHCGVNAA